MRPLFLHFFIILFFTSLSFEVFAQPASLVDSLQAELENHPERDTTRLAILLELGNKLMYADPVQTISLGYESLALADSLGDLRQKAFALNQLANVLRTQSDNGKAMEYYFSALEIFEQLDDQKWVANLHGNIGNIHLSQENFPEARKEIELAIQIREEIGYYDRMEGLFNSLGNIYAWQQSYDSALVYYQMALDSSIKHGNRAWMAMFMGNVGNVYGWQGEYAQSREKSLEALAIHRELGLLVDQSRDLHNIGFAYHKEKRCDSAVTYYSQAYELANSLGLKNIQVVSSQGLMECYFKLGQASNAEKWSAIMVAAQDSLRTEEVTRQVENAENRYRIEREQMELQFAKETEEITRDAALKRNRIISWSAGTGFVLISLFAGVLFLRYREKHAYNSQLEETVEERTSQLQQVNVQLTREISEKELARRDLNTFIHRSSHDLKGPLASIDGLVEVARKEKEPAPYLEMISKKTQQLDLVLNQLIDKVEIGDRELEAKPMNWESVKERVEAELAHLPGREAVDLRWVAPFPEGIHSDAFGVELVLRQWIKNAIQFRDPEKSTSWCEVKVEGTPDRWRLSVQDNGLGIAETDQPRIFDMFFTTQKMAEASGLGLYIVKETVQRMGGELAFLSEPGKGTRFVAEFS